MRWSTPRLRSQYLSIHPLFLLLPLLTLDSGKKLEYPERTHTDTRGTCKLHTGRPQPNVRIKLRTYLLWGNGANHHPTILTQQCFIHFLKFSKSQKLLQDIPVTMQHTLTCATYLGLFEQCLALNMEDKHEMCCNYQLHVTWFPHFSFHHLSLIYSCLFFPSLNSILNYIQSSVTFITLVSSVQLPICFFQTLLIADVFKWVFFTSLFYHLLILCQYCILHILIFLCSCLLPHFLISSLFLTCYHSLPLAFFLTPELSPFPSLPLPWVALLLFPTFLLHTCHWYCILACHFDAFYLLGMQLFP